MSHDADVLIIGGGAAGLSAARRLVRENLRVILIEARDRLGGRIHTIHPQAFPMPIDLGAEFVHGKPPETWELILAAHLLTYEIAERHWHFVDGKLQAADDFWEKIDKVLGKMDEHGPEQTFAAFLKTCCPEADQATRDMTIAFIEGFNAARADRISTTALAAEQKAADEIDETHQYRIVGGYAPMLAWMESALAGAVDVRLSTVVREVQWKLGEVVAVCETATRLSSSKSSGGPAPSFKAKHAIVTLPLPALQKDQVKFSPALPQKREAARKLEMGPIVKLILNFREAFWERETIPNARGAKLPPLTFMHSTSADVPTWWTQLPIQTTVLTGWAGGPKADALSHRKPEEILAKGLDSLAEMTGFSRGEIESLAQAWEIADWQSDPFSGGAYSYVPVKAGDARKELAEPVNNTLFFAGEATHFEGHSGTVAGALATGTRAAEEVIRAQL
jgi:monoamine oxidase